MARNWKALEDWERSKLVMLERAANKCAHSSIYYPDDMVECPYCGNPSSSGLCNWCSEDLKELLEKVSCQK